MEKEKLKRAPEIPAVFEKAKATRFPSLAVLRRAAEVANVVPSASVSISFPALPIRLDFLPAAPRCG